MKSAISTRLIPILFNGKDYNAAQKLKKIIDKNYLFIGDFFLGYKKITTFPTPTKTNIEIEDEEQLKSYLKARLEKYKREILPKAYSEADNQDIQFLKFMYIDSLNIFDESNQLPNNKTDYEATINAIYSMVAISYYKDDEDKLVEFIVNPSDEEKNKIFEWLKEKHRFEILSDIISDLFFDITYEDDKVIDTIFYNNLDIVLAIANRNISRGLVLTEPNHKPKIASLSKEELDSLNKEFLIEFDPSLKWLKIYEDAKKNGRIIDGKNNDYDWSCIHQNGRVCINENREETIEDFIFFMHEFAHYVSMKDLSDLTIPQSLAEFPPRYFELCAEQFLISKGYDEKQIDYISRKRNIWFQNAEITIIPTLKYMLDVLDNGRVTLESEVENIPDELTDDEKAMYESTKAIPNYLICFSEGEIIDKCDSEVKYLLEKPDEIANLYSYVVGNYLAQLAFSKTIENPLYVYDMLELTENLSTTIPETVFRNLGVDVEPQETSKKIEK